jgi:hypothetical protein
MIYIYKGSPTPIVPWDAVRHGGPNNLDLGIKGKYLVLLNADIVQREGKWHYIFEFDARDTLQTSALAHIVGEASKYPGDIDWKSWLGEGCELINASVREAILTMPPEEAKTGAVITGMRECPAARPIPGRDPKDAYQIELSREFMLCLPHP